MAGVDVSLSAGIDFVMMTAAAQPTASTTTATDGQKVHFFTFDSRPNIRSQPPR
ncbi:hypothetical protein AB3K78_01290 [Leucobacter sp. HNU]|uniref:hypothetical protein n=1 Tax=Leucobacter sp. HNU TaxID=3236805 RepID=UPI003A80DA13